MTTKDYGRKHGVSDSTLQPQRSNHSLKDLIHKAPLPEYRVWTSPPSAETAATKKHVTPTVKRNKTSELERTLEKFQSENLTKHLPVATDLLKSVSAILDVGDTSKDTKSLPLSLSPEELLYVGEEVFASASPDKLISPALDHNSSNRTRVKTKILVLFQFNGLSRPVVPNRGFPDPWGSETRLSWLQNAIFEGGVCSLVYFFSKEPRFIKACK